MINLENIELNNKMLIFETTPIFRERLYYPLTFKFDNVWIPIFDFDDGWELPKKWFQFDGNMEKLLEEKIGIMGGKLNLHEISNLISIFENFLNYDENRLISDLLPKLSIKGGKRSLNLLKKLSSLPEKLKNGVAKHNFNLPLLSILFDFEKNEIENILSIFDEFPLSGGSKRKFLEDCYDIKVAMELNLQNILDRIDFHILRGVENKPEASKKLMENIHRLKYPTLSEVERKFTELRGHLRFSKGVFFIKPEYFEDENYEIKIRFKNIEELKERIKNLIEISENPYMGEILNLI